MSAAFRRPAIDFLAGTKAEAPAWVQRLSLEWLFRFVSEPRRLWRRYTVELGRLAVLVVRELRGQRRLLAAPEMAAATGRPGG